MCLLTQDEICQVRRRRKRNLFSNVFVMGLGPHLLLGPSPSSPTHPHQSPPLPTGCPTPTTQHSTAEGWAGWGARVSECTRTVHAPCYTWLTVMKMTRSLTMYLNMLWSFGDPLSSRGKGEARVGGGIRWSELKWSVIRREGGRGGTMGAFRREELSYYVFICIFFLFYLICSRWRFSYRPGYVIFVGN